MNAHVSFDVPEFVESEEHLIMKFLLELPFEISNISITWDGSQDEVKK